MKNMRRFLSLMLAMMLCLGAFSMTALAVNPFTDVPTTEWYYSDIDHAYQMELINGKTPTLFMPNDYLTYAEAVKLAACMNQRYTTGSVTLKNGEPWYQTYVDYCKEEGIISKDYSWNASATRAGYMEIFADALPDAAMKEINDIPDGSIPDVPTSHPQAAPIYKLYRVGILQGNDLAHNCNPAANIKRAEVAAILTRMMDSSSRIRFTMGDTESKPVEKEEEDTEPLKIKTQPQSTEAEVGDTVSLSVEAKGGSKPYAYSWEIYGAAPGKRSQWLAVSDLTSRTISVKIPEAAAGSELRYRCVITDDEGEEVTSDAAVITVAAKKEEEKTEPLQISMQPENVKASVGDAPYFDMEVYGGKAPYQFNWFIGEEGGGRTVTGMYGIQVKDEPAYGFSEMQVLITDDFEYSAADRYFFYCVATDAEGNSVTSNYFDITVISGEFKVEIDAPSRVRPGETAALTVKASGGKAPYRFSWMGYNEDDYSQGFTTSAIYWKGVNVSTGSSSSTLTVDTSQCEAKAFKCEVTDAAGNRYLAEFEFSVY